MAQLPPKAPNWGDLNQQRFVPSVDDCLGNNNNSSSWMDEFLDFSSSKRGSHRRSISDSMAFLEIIMPTEEEESRLAGGSSSGGDLDRFDDDQLMMSMFNDSLPIAPNNNINLHLSNPSSPSDDHNNSTINEDNDDDDDDQQIIMLKKQLKSEPHHEDAVESSCKTQASLHYQLANTHDIINSTDKIVDPKRIKRILANRQSAQRSRVRKLHYVSELERSVTSLQSEVSVLSPRVAFLDHQRMLLTLDNGVLNQRLAALAQDKIFKDAHQEALKREIERLRQVYYQQNLKKMESDDNNNVHQMRTEAVSPMHMDTNCPLEKEQLAN